MVIQVVVPILLTILAFWPRLGGFDTVLLGTGNYASLFKEEKNSNSMLTNFCL